jgi:hypothetical protein
MTITIRRPLVRDVRYQDSSIIELRLVDSSSSFIDLVFASIKDLDKFLQDAIEHKIKAKEHSRKI